MSLGGNHILQSMPAELTAGVAARPVKPDRERIRTILNMGNVIELQRQLLTTVMENEVRTIDPERVRASSSFMAQFPSHLAVIERYS